jgi:hypothetical protein
VCGCAWRTVGPERHVVIIIDNGKVAEEATAGAVAANADDELAITSPGHSSCREMIR